MDFENDITNSLTYLLSGGIILYPTDTIWGLGCDATNAAAIKKIYQLKKREEKKSLIILADDENMIREYVDKPSEKLLTFISSAKKPTTAIFSNAVNLSHQLVSEDGTIAIRIVNEVFCQKLIQRLQRPLVSTSANVSGEPSPQNFTEISNEIKNGVDYIIQHRQDDLSKHTPSSIIKLDEKGEIQFIR